MWMANLDSLRNELKRVEAVCANLEWEVSPEEFMERDSLRSMLREQEEKLMRAGPWTS